jgi:hypothetical protein
MNRIFRNLLLISLLVPIYIIPALQQAIAEDTDTSAGTTLRWNPKVGSSYTYLLSSYGTHGEQITGRSEDFTVVANQVSSGGTEFIATGEKVPDGASLAYRFQRSLFPQSKYTVDSLGNTTTSPGQPFPLFINIPVFPKGPVSEGSVWEGGPAGIIPDTNVGPIPFTYTSKLTSIATYLGERCALIDTDYKVALPPDAKSLMPFLGLVEGDKPEEPGHGAPIGGVVKDSRANKAGILPGDIIIAAEGQKIRGWGGLKEILPLLVPEMPVKFRVLRDGKELDIEIAPEGIPLVSIAGTGGLHSTCYFSLDSGVPLKVDLTSTDLIFTLTNAQGETEERPASMHITLEFQHAAPAPAG